MNISRRRFLGTSAAFASGAFVIGFTLRTRAQDTPGTPGPSENPFDAWVHIKPDGSAELVLAQSEMGQGVYTSLPMLLAEEADLDWQRVTVVQSDFSLGTGGSGSVMSNYVPLRRAGAQVRIAMVAAAARTWKVLESECTTEKSEVLHAASGRKLAYGELVPQARRMPIPDAKTVKLKDSAQFTLIGRETAHLDIPDKCTGATLFGLDVRVPGMVHAVIARCPTFGGTPAKFDATKALSVPGVIQVFDIPARGHRVYTAGGVVVVAKSTWAAMQGRKALDITWNYGPNHSETTDSLRAQMKDALSKPPAWTSDPKGDDLDSLPAAKRRGERVRVPVPGSRDHGADEYHHPLARREVRCMGSLARCGRDAQDHSEGTGVAGDEYHGAHHVHGGWIRPAVSIRLPDRGRADCAPCLLTGAVGVDARRRHDP